MAQGDNAQSSTTRADAVVSGDAAVVARRYASALYALADEQKQLDAVAADMRALQVLVRDSAEFRAVAAHPRLKRADLVTIVAKVAESAKLNKLTANFLGLLAHNRRLDGLLAMAQSFLAEFAQRRGEYSADVRTAHPLSAEQQETLVASLCALAGGKVHVNMREDKALLGGLVVKLGSRLIDASVKGKLERLERQLKTGS